MASRHALRFAAYARSGAFAAAAVALLGPIQLVNDRPAYARRRCGADQECFNTRAYDTVNEAASRAALVALLMLVVVSVYFRIRGRAHANEDVLSRGQRIWLTARQVSVALGIAAVLIGTGVVELLGAISGDTVESTIVLQGKLNEQGYTPAPGTVIVRLPSERGTTIHGIALQSSRGVQVCDVSMPATGDWWPVVACR